MTDGRTSHKCQMAPTHWAVTFMEQVEIFVQQFSACAFIHTQQCHILGSQQAQVQSA